MPVLRPAARLARKVRRQLIKTRDWYRRAQRPVRSGTLMLRYRRALAPGQVYFFPFADAGNGTPPMPGVSATSRFEVSRAQLLTEDSRDTVIQAEIIELLQSHERVPGLSNRDRSSSQAGERPIIVVDVRCLQDPSYPLRNIAEHAAHVLRTVVDACGKENDVALLINATLPNLDPDLAAFGRYCISSSQKIDTACVKQLVELSPMTASPGPVLSLLLTPGIHKIAVIYDFIPNDFPGHYLSTDEERISYKARLAALARYDSFLAVSETAASRLTAIIGKDAPVSVTGIADPLPQIEAEPPGPTDELVPFSTFVLVAGGADARKNLLAAIAAHASYSGTRRRHLGLVVIGEMPAEMESAAVGFAADCGLGTHRLKFCSGLNDRQLRSLYSRATVVIVPSFAEGFSLPVIEAIDAGTPVVASNIAAHRELLGAGWWLANPDDPLALGQSVDRALKDAQNLLASERAAIGNRFAAEDVTSRLRNALTQTPAPQKAVDVAPLPRPAKNGRPRLAVITPFPPQQSGIASYTAFTMQAVEKYADVDIFTDTRQKLSAYDGMELHPYAIEPYINRGFDAVVSVLGNSPVHIPILEYFLQFGGACLAHDPRMIELYHRLRGPAGLASLLSRHFREPIPADCLHDITYAEDRDLLPATVYDEIAPQAQPLMVHSENLSRRIFAETGVESVILPYVPHHLPHANKVDPEIVSSARHSLGWRDESIHIATFGTLDQRAKGIEIIVDAVAWLHQWGVSCDLHFVGPASLKDRNELLLRAQRLGLSRAVHFTGWIPTDRWEAYLLAVDAAVQLRTFTPFPVTSRSLLDCAAFGVPTVATDNLAIELHTPAYIGSIPDRFSALLVAESLADLLESRRLEASVKNESPRRDWLKTRTADSYARHLLAALNLGEYTA